MKSPKLKRKSKSIDKKKSPLLKKMKQYLQTTQKDWNYITPLDFYNNYYNYDSIYCASQLLNIPFSSFGNYIRQL